MKEEDQRAVIADACGWTKPKPYRGPIEWCPSDEYFEPPDYLNDLNACHEMEKALTAEQCYLYAQILGEGCGVWEPKNGPRNWPFHATAAQRAEAFLKTLGKWSPNVPSEPRGGQTL